MEDAKRIMVYKQGGGKSPLADKFNYRNYPDDMCFARALSKGARRFCPDALGGQIYAEGEVLERIEGPSTDKPKDKPKPKPKDKESKAQNTKKDAEYLKHSIFREVMLDWYSNHRTTGGTEPSFRQLRRICEYAKERGWSPEEVKTQAIDDNWSAGRTVKWFKDNPKQVRPNPPETKDEKHHEEVEAPKSKEPYDPREAYWGAEPRANYEGELVCVETWTKLKDSLDTVEDTLGAIRNAKPKAVSTLAALTEDQASAYLRAMFPPDEKEADSMFDDEEPVF